MMREDTAKIISIAENFNEWLTDMAEKYEWDKSDIQALIKQILI